jgi:predicted ATPase
MRLPESTPVNPLPEIAGYEILGTLRRGGMGVVYKARQQSLDRLVALKFLPEECTQDPGWLDRFWRDARTASALNHPHICTIYDTGEWAGQRFLSMEWIEGHTFEKLVGQSLPVEELARLVGQVAKALRAAHDAGIMHRDIKPANLMVREDGIVKVLDFGSSWPQPTNTLQYLSPEQIRAEPVGSASDIFSLGLVLYELATGQHPYPADSEHGEPHSEFVESPIAAARLNPEIPTALDTLILQMLAKDPHLRPTAAEVDAILTELSKKAKSKRGRANGLTVGREHERETLRTCFESAVAGRGLLLCVTGEPGLGKTTLVENFLDELAKNGRLYSLSRGRCSERLAGAEAYLPILEALNSLLEGEGGAAAGRVMKLLAPSWYVRLVPMAADDPDLASMRPAIAGATQERLKRELDVFLQEMSRLRPLVLFLDDVHWADASTVDLLAYLGSHCVRERLLMVLAYRPSDLALSHHPFATVKLELQGRDICREIALSFLSRSDLDRYLTLAFAGHHFPEQFAALIHARTAGNPLFVVDLLRYLRDRGLIIQSHGHWNLVSEVHDLHRELPDSIRGMIERKMNQLSEADHRLVLAASVQGPEFDSAVVAHLLDREPEDVEERLDVLERLHALVRLVREHAFPDGTLSLRYVFVHALYHNALYAALDASKTSWSAAAAEVILGHYGEHRAAVAAELALLFEAARDSAQAAEHFLQAAENAVRISAHPEAIELSRRGLTLLAQLPDTPARSRAELTLLIALGVSLVATQGFAAPEVEQTYIRARALSEQMEGIPTLLPVLYGLWNLYLVRCELDRCAELAAQMFSLAQVQGDQVSLLVAHNVLQQPLFHSGQFAAARRHQEQGLALYDPHQHSTLTAVYGEDPGVECLAYGAATLWQLGYPEQALRSVIASQRLAEELGHPFNLAQALYYGALTHLCRREANSAQELAEGLMELCREHDFALLLAGGMILYGYSLTEQATKEKGIHHMRQGLAAWQATGARSHRAYQLALLADALGRDGQIQEGLTALTEALAFCSATGERFWEAELYRLQGELLLRAGDAALSAGSAAEASFRRSLDVAGEQRAKSLELRALMSLGRRFQKQGRQAEVGPLLATTYGWFTEGFDTSDLQDAKALLEELT